ncbi:MAG: hypothetical protein AVDCRST_MAG59-4855, partial [uncultured Thermomicrobiales bacterium]
ARVAADRRWHRHPDGSGRRIRACARPASPEVEPAFGPPECLSVAAGSQRV